MAAPFQFSAPSYHNFQEDDNDVTDGNVDDAYFDPSRPSNAQDFFGVRTVTTTTITTVLETVVETHVEQEQEREHEPQQQQQQQLEVSVTTSVAPEPAPEAAPEMAPEAEAEPEAEDDAVGAEAEQYEEPQPGTAQKRKREANVGLTLTKPSAPKLATAARTRNETRISSTSRELAKIVAERAQMAKRTRRNSEYMKVALELGQSADLPVRSVKPLTVPEPFQLRTAAIAPKAVSAAPPAPPASSHPMLLRSTSRHGSVTKVTPFNLATDSRAAMRRASTPAAPPATPYVPLAEKLVQLENATPDRFRTKPTPVPPTAQSSPHTTTPAPFHFATEDVAKNRPVPKPTDEIILESAPAFKARPFDPRIAASSGDLGVPKVPKRKVTTPDMFSLRSDSRAEVAAAQTKAKLEAEAAAEAAARQFKARPVPRVVEDPSAVFAPKPADRPLTVPEPFQMPGMSIHERAEMERRQRLEREAEEARKAAQFHAKPLPATHVHAFVPAHAEAPITVPETFELATDKRAEHWKENDARRAERERQAAAEEAKRQAEKQAEEATEIARLRREELTFKARPVSFNK